jgi:hypothetical protein
MTSGSQDSGTRLDGARLGCDRNGTGERGEEAVARVGLILPTGPTGSPRDSEEIVSKDFVIIPPFLRPTGGPRPGTAPPRDGLILWVIESQRRALLRLAERDLGSDLRTKGDAADLVQQTCLEALRDAHTFHGHTEAEAACWLRAILRNNVRSLARKCRRSGGRGDAREVSLDALLGKDGSVSALPPAEDGRSVRSPPSAPGSVLPTALASPQSTTSVSPCVPTITFPGLRSRWSTPRECAYAIALQTSVNRRSSFRSPSDRRPGSRVSSAAAWKCSMASLRLSPLMNRMA